MASIGRMTYHRMWNKYRYVQDGGVYDKKGNFILELDPEELEEVMRMNVNTFDEFIELKINDHE